MQIHDPTQDQCQEEFRFLPSHSILSNNEEQPQTGSPLSTNPSGTHAVITLLQNAMPGMGALTEFLHKLDTNLPLDRQSYDLLIQVWSLQPCLRDNWRVFCPEGPQKIGSKGYVSFGCANTNVICSSIKSIVACSGKSMLHFSE